MKPVRCQPPAPEKGPRSLKLKRGRAFSVLETQCCDEVMLTPRPNKKGC